MEIEVVDYNGEPVVGATVRIKGDMGRNEGTGMLEIEPDLEGITDSNGIAQVE